MLFRLKLGREWTERDCEVIQIIVGCFCFAENRGMLPSIELLVFSLIELDVIVINRRLWLKTFCLYCYFSVFGGITDKCVDL